MEFREFRILQIRILGPLEVVGEGGPVDTGTPKQRAVLAMLTMQPGRTVSVQRLIDELWADEPPERAIASLQAYVSRLRRALEPGRTARDRSTVLVSRAPGYQLMVPADAVDAARFAAAVERARTGTRARRRRCGSSPTRCNCGGPTRCRSWVTRPWRGPSGAGCRSCG